MAEKEKGVTITIINSHVSILRDNCLENWKEHGLLIQRRSLSAMRCLETHYYFWLVLPNPLTILPSTQYPVHILLLLISGKFLITPFFNTQKFIMNIFHEIFKTSVFSLNMFLNHGLKSVLLAKTIRKTMRI